MAGRVRHRTAHRLPSGTAELLTRSSAGGGYSCNGHRDEYARRKQAVSGSLAKKWLVPGALIGVITLSILGALIILGGPQRSAGAGACTEVTSAGCRPFLDALYEEMGGQGSEVASVRGRPWCGEDTCEILFGAEALRLRVSFYDGTFEEFSCWRSVLGRPSCEPAGFPGER